MNNYHRIKKILFLILAIAAGIVIYRALPMLAIATGYAAKQVCTCTFSEDRQQPEIEKNQLYFSILGQVTNTIDHQAQSVTSSFLGLYPKIAEYRPGIGCVLLYGADDYDVQFPKSNAGSVRDSLFEKVQVTQGLDQDQLNKAISHAFDADKQLVDKRTTAVLVIHKDTLIAEQYAPPFGPNTVQLGWSMTKSLMNTYAGLLVAQGKMKITDDHLFAEWDGDDRKHITITDLLHMNTGLSWDENYAGISDATNMLYRSEDVSAIARSKPLKHPIGSYWYYSSGTTNLLSRYYRNVTNNDHLYWTMLKDSLFDVIGMHSAFIETDETGTFIGSSYGYATPRDWARFGLLYLHQGMWNGKRLLPEGWVTFSTTPAEGSNGQYGAQFWLNQNGVQFPDAPHDTYNADGFQGQFVFIIPSRDVVIVRMGTGKDGFDVNQFLKEILDALPQK